MNLLCSFATSAEPWWDKLEEAQEGTWPDLWARGPGEIQYVLPKFQQKELQKTFPDYWEILM